MVVRVGVRGASVLIAACVAAMLASWAASAAQQAAPLVTTPRWHVVKTIQQNGLDLLDVAAVRGGRTWVGGDYPAGASLSGPLFYHFTGARWVRIVRPPGITSGDRFVSSLSASTDANVWGGLNGRAAIDHWNGHAWTRFTFPHEHAYVAAVAAVGRHQGWVFFSHSTASFFNGIRFRAYPLPAAVYAVSAPSRSDVWGWAIANSYPYPLMALHFNGTKWLKVKFPTALIAAAGVPGLILAESPINVWSTMPRESTTGRIQLVHWNGTKWQLVGGKRGPLGRLQGPIASDGHGGLWLYAERRGAQFFVHYSNGTFTTQALPTPPGGVLFGDIALVPGTRSLYGVGTVEGALHTIGGVIYKFGR